jgi:ketosteroid isomerase-like protein
MKTLFTLLLAGLMLACAKREDEIENAMARYDHLIFKMQADSIASCFMPDGTLGGVGMKTQVGRDSIRKFLNSFDPATITLISNRSTTKSIVFKGDTAVQEGSYEQKALVNGDTGVYTGSYTAHWLKGDRAQWLLKKMYTKPTKELATIKSVLLKQFKTTHTDKNWFVPANLAVEGLTAKQASWKDGSGNHSIGQLTTHLIFWNERLLKKFNNQPEGKFSGNNDETFDSFDEKQWSGTVKRMDSVFTAWEHAIKKSDDAKLTDWYEDIANMSTHNAYHTGQIIYLRKLQGSWDSAKGVK